MGAKRGGQLCRSLTAWLCPSRVRQDSVCPKKRTGKRSRGGGSTPYGSVLISPGPTAPRNITRWLPPSRRANRLRTAGAPAPPRRESLSSSIASCYAICAIAISSKLENCAVVRSEGGRGQLERQLTQAGLRLAVQYHHGRATGYSNQPCECYSVLDSVMLLNSVNATVARLIAVSWSTQYAVGTAQEEISIDESPLVRHRTIS